MTIELYPWQRRDVDQIAANNYVALLNLHPGAGKTVESIFAAKESGAKQVLVIAPLNTHRSAWGNEVKEILGVDIRTVGNARKAEKEALFDLEIGEPGWYCVTPQLMARKGTDISNWLPDFVIADEIHTYSKPKSPSQRKLEQIGKQVPMKLALSGTPLRRDFTRAWSITRFLHPERYLRGDIAADNFWLFCRDRLKGVEVYTNQRNPDGTPKKVMKWLAEAEPGKLFSEMPCVIQHFRRERCCPDHPQGFLQEREPQVIERIVPLVPEQKKIIRDLEESYLAWIEEQPFVVDLTITQKQRLRQVCLGVPTLEEYEVVDEFGQTEIKQTLNFDADCKSPLADEVLDILENLPDGEPCLVYMESKRFAKVMVQRIAEAGYSVAEYSGDTKNERDGYLERFGKDIQVMVAIISAFGTGTNGAQKVAQTEIFCETSVDDTANEQVEGRLDRLGAKGQVQRWLLHDDLGYSEGRIGDALVKRIEINKSARKI
jgi:hypothetical protein